MQEVLWSTGRERRGRLLDVFLLIHGRKETASGCLPGWTALEQLALVLLKLGVLLPKVSVEAYAQDPAFRARGQHGHQDSAVVHTFPERGHLCTSVKGRLTWNSDLVV